MPVAQLTVKACALFDGKLPRLDRRARIAPLLSGASSRSPSMSSPLAAARCGCRAEPGRTAAADSPGAGGRSLERVAPHGVPGRGGSRSQRERNGLGPPSHAAGGSPGSDAASRRWPTRPMKAPSTGKRWRELLAHCTGFPPSRVVISRAAPRQSSPRTWSASGETLKRGAGISTEATRSPRWS